ncbi:SIR2 family protein [Agrobacterium tumefaciens]|uniref:P-loop NTPase n=1 Tax=Agrobacterium tumefaciens TaxID=358 RepID=UPI001AE2CD6C|nr:SIR2 family protein [Agrobacterium tumefaciens]MBP2537586.1 tetratricopeptide (TPR) repeat protein [Agrobacterium tumefaciens]
MFTIAEHNGNLLRKAVTDGNVVLLLGAGTSATSLNAQGQKVKLGKALAAELANMSGLPYSGEDLPDVIQAVRPRISEVQLHQLFTKEFTRIIPAAELNDLLQYSWQRIYTWNIDDAIENVRSSAQLRRYYNGLKDRVATNEGIEFLHVIHLHGEAAKPEHGFIFGPSEYNRRLNENKHDWYRQVATDYAAHVPVFIGSTLREPILSAEIDRARPNAEASLGTAFLITPDDFTPLQKAAYETRNIVVIKGTLADFINWLKGNLGHGITPLQISKEQNSFTDALATKIVATRSEITTANSILVQTWQDAKKRADELQGLKRRQAARAFLEGEPPSWTLAASDIPVWLSATDELYIKLSASIAAEDRMFLVYGQSGSGKTTALLQSLLRYLRENKGSAVYELKGDVKSLRASLELITRLHPDEHVVIYVGDAFIYGDALSEDALSLPRGKFTLVSSARSNEWRQHIERRVGDFTTSFEFQRFVQKDHAALIDRLLQYVPSPLFLKMAPHERTKKLAASQEQLLIALKETTTSEKFTKVITEEYESIPDVDTRSLFLIVGLATIARTGISKPAAREAYDKVKKELSFDRALGQLEGIVSANNIGRLVARHELYVRHIVDNVADFAAIVDAAVEVLRTYTKYALPIVKNVDRQDALLFKFILNHNFIGDLARRRNAVEEALRIFESFEIDFQLDGHFWLQFGQYLSMFGELEPAMRALEKSIAAYPENVFAVHALADLRLRVALDRETYDATTVALIGDAVETLEGLHVSQHLETDFYPIVTLASNHISALIKHKQHPSAKSAAQRYFRMIAAMRRTDMQIDRARERLAHYLTHGTWEKAQSAQNGRSKHRNRRRRR